MQVYCLSCGKQSYGVEHGVGIGSLLIYSCDPLTSSSNIVIVSRGSLLVKATHVYQKKRCAVRLKLARYRRVHSATRPPRTHYISTFRVVRPNSPFPPRKTLLLENCAACCRIISDGCSPSSSLYLDICNSTSPPSSPSIQSTKWSKSSLTLPLCWPLARL
jgi:hypothetical protein